MKQFFFTIALTFFTASGINAQYFRVDTAKLNTTYSELTKNPHSKEKQEAFFNAFPNNWNEFITTYGFCAGKGYDLTMYNAAHNHIKALGNISLINDTTYCRKLVNLAVGAEYKADAPNYFKRLLHHVMHEKINAMLYTVSQLRKGHCMQFWQFYWSCNGKSKELEMEFPSLYEIITDKYPDMIKTIEIAYHYFYNGVNIDGGYLKGSGRAYDNNGQYLFPIHETQAEFPGGTKALKEWIKSNLCYPKECIEKSIEGKAFVRFIVRTDGSIDDVELIKSSGNSELDKEALRLINKDMPKWIPATQFIDTEDKFINIDCRCVIPIDFKLHKGVR